MQLSEMERLLELSPIVKPVDQGNEVTGGYVSDLLSDVMGNACAGSVWITIQAHQNTVAVAVLAELAAIILSNGVMPDTHTIQKAEDKGIPIYSSPKSTFTLAGELFQAGVPSTKKQT